MIGTVQTALDRILAQKTGFASNPERGNGGPWWFGFALNSAGLDVLR